MRAREAYVGFYEEERTMKKARPQKPTVFIGEGSSEHKLHCAKGWLFTLNRGNAPGIDREAFRMVSWVRHEREI
eukprot:scaffold2637_cov421-Pavlova_lutheri.AAC.1